MGPSVSISYNFIWDLERLASIHTKKSSHNTTTKNKTKAIEDLIKQIEIPKWMKEWGVGDPNKTPGGLAESGPKPEAAVRQVTLMQRKKQKLGRNLGKTTGWIHRSSLNMKNVHMIGDVNYEEITSEGIMVSDGEIRENPRLLPADTIVICAGQESERSLADDLMERGKKVHIIGGAAVASELDAKRAIDQGVRLAISL